MAMSRCRGGTPVMVLPAMRNSPAVMVSSPAIERSSVDLPHPEGPTRATKLPFSMVSEMSLSAWKLP